MLYLYNIYICYDNMYKETKMCQHIYTHMYLVTIIYIHKIFIINWYGFNRKNNMYASEITNYAHNFYYTHFLIIKLHTLYTRKIYILCLIQD